MGSETTETITWYPVSVEPPRYSRCLLRRQPWAAPRVVEASYMGNWQWHPRYDSVTRWAHMPKGPGDE